MSAEPKWCFSNCSKGGTKIFALRTPPWFRGCVSPNQIHLLFGTFGQKMGQKGLKIGLKCLGLVWYGLAWAACDPGSWLSPKLCSKLSKIARLKVWLLGLREESQNYLNEAVEIFFEFRPACVDPGSQAKPYHTKPRNFRPIFGPFWPIFWPKGP